MSDWCKTVGTAGKISRLSQTAGCYTLSRNRHIHFNYLA